MSTSSLEQAVEFMWKTAVSIRNDRGEEVEPIGFAFKEDELAILPLNQVPYTSWRNALRAIAATGVDIVGTVSEAWGVKVAPEDAAAYGAARALGVRNEDRPDRIEILQVIAEDTAGRIFCLKAEIKEGRVGDPEKLKDGEELGGRLTGLFPPLEKSGL